MSEPDVRDEGKGSDGSSRDRPSAFDQAVKLLARRTHFRAEIEAKLRKRSYPALEIETAVARLEELGYLDDQAAAREYVRLNRERKGWGRARLRAELLRRGVSDAAVAGALGDLTDEGERELARREVERWRSSRSDDPRRLARRLERKGFAGRVIVSVLEEAGVDLFSSD
ncbi:MAG: regulatory protein RecX [Thermoanaerobaculia bacterium]|nr:regulatory protein RecX [Thermoanaerobaculia bacterium]